MESGYCFVIQGTIEACIVERHYAKCDPVDSLLEGTAVNSELSAEELLLLTRR